MKEVSHNIKIIISIIAIISAILLFDYYTTNRMNKISNNLLTDVNSLISYISEEDKNKSINLTESIISDWKNESKVLGIFIDHANIESISVTLDRVYINLLNSNFKASLSETQTIITKIEANKERERLSISNIL